MSKKIDLILADALVEKGLVDQKQMDVLVPDADSSGEGLQSILLKRGILSEKDILTVLAEKLRLAYVQLKDITVEKTVLDKVPVKIASYYGFVPLKISGRILTIAVPSPLEIKIQDEIRTQLGYGIEIALAGQNDIADALKKCYGLGADTFNKMGASDEKAAFSMPSEEPQRAAVEDIAKMAGDASVIRLVNQILLDGWRKRATDIHIEPQRQGVNLRYRIDGMLCEAQVAPEIKNFLSAIISRIKIMSNLNIVERRLPQDGRAIVKVQDQMLDLRISTIPTPFGESVVIRLLPSQMLFSLEKLGLPKREMQALEALIQKPHGIIFVTGPTGSGKTTTLYSCLSRINTRERKIITLEDPIEYEMAGVTQIQVMPEIDFNFARGLRSVLRHDPDVIMLGEVRDLETAEIAIRVALTGHLVFSTLHTNDAASGITRLIDIGVEPYLLSSSVEEFIAQRLIRTICQDCKMEDKSIPEELKLQIARDLGLKSVSDVKVYKGKGCPTCNQTGFFGRVAIYEFLPIDEDIKDMIVRKTPSNQIQRLAVSKGMRTLRQDGWQKVITGLTTPEEVMKMTPAEKEETATGRRSWMSSVSLPVPRSGTYPAGQAGLSKEESSQSAAGRLPPLGHRFPEGKEPMAAGGSERRVYMRLDSKVNIRFQAFRTKEELFRHGVTPEQLSVTTNISASGLFFVSREPIIVGSILDMKIELPNADEAIECLAKVVRVEEVEAEKIYNVMVSFLDITSSQRTKLNKYVENTES